MKVAAHVRFDNNRRLEKQNIKAHTCYSCSKRRLFLLFVPFLHFITIWFSRYSSQKQS